MEELQWHSSESRLERGWAFCASLLLHALLFLILTSSTAFELAVGEQSRFDLMFWVSPSSALPFPQVPPGERGAALPSNRQVAEPVKKSPPPAPQRQLPDSAPAAARSPAPATSALMHAAAEGAVTVALPEPPAAAAMLFPAANSAAARPPRESATSGVSSQRPGATFAQRTQQVEIPTAAPNAPVAVAPAAVEQVPFGPVAGTPVPAAPVHGAPGHAAPDPVPAAASAASAATTDAPAAAARPLAAAASPVAAALPQRTIIQEENSVARQRQAALEASKQEDAAVASGAPAPPGATDAAHARAAGNPARETTPAATRERQAPVEKPPEPKGIVASTLKGDLKMVITGGSGIRLLITFREFPKARRNRPLSRSEARREQRVQPVIARREQTQEAVIETARDGVYLFSVEPEQGDNSRASFTLKVYEAGSGERIAAIGSRIISGKTLLARVLMRDGILWDDDSFFTNSIEDAESTTKFNAKTGLYWKEYHLSP